MTRIEYQPAAHADLVEVWLQIAEDSVERADSYISKLQGICELIADQPTMGSNRPDIADEVRSFPVDRLVIYYEQRDSIVSVLRVWHAARDPRTFSINPEL